ncbi:putative boron transporter 6 [Bienertia sinuspersici]
MGNSIPDPLSFISLIVMDKPTIPFEGIVRDFKGRIRFYQHDWLKETSVNTVETLISTAICGVIHSVFGGQPLLILGVAEPTVIMYTYLYNISQKNDKVGKQLFLAWAAWVCLWTALFLFLLAMFNACNLISRFTRLAGELFGMLISVLFMQEAVKGLIDEFRAPHGRKHGQQGDDFLLIYINGLLALVFSFGVLFTSLKSIKARSWQYGTGWFRSFIADYGVPFMIVLWTVLSYTVPSRLSSEIPRRLDVPSPWDSTSQSHWIDMSKVPVFYILAASIPAVMIAGLYFFDHSVASQMAQQEEFNLMKPSSFHYDLFLLGLMTLICGLLGLPPCNGVLPQAPMHTKSLAVLRRQLLRKKMIAKAKECMNQDSSNMEMYQKLHDTFLEMEPDPDEVGIAKELRGLKEAVMSQGGHTKKFDPAKHIDAHLPIRVLEQRWSNLLQSLLVGLAVGAIPIIKQIPTSVLWGYFAFMSLDSLPGNQFWERLPLLLSTTRKPCFICGVSAIQIYHVIYSIPVSIFSLLFWSNMDTYSRDFVSIAILLLIPIREYLLPKLIPSEYLQELDAAEYEEVIGAPHVPITSGDKINLSIKDCIAEYQEIICSPNSDMPTLNEEAVLGNLDDEDERDVYDEEIFDVMTTRRGELKHRISDLRSRSRSRVVFEPRLKEG